MFAHVLRVCSEGMEEGGSLAMGFLSFDDLTVRYSPEVPFVSNPYVTMLETARHLAGRSGLIQTRVMCRYGQARMPDGQTKRQTDDRQMTDLLTDQQMRQVK